MSRILLIEDDAPLRGVMAEALQSAGHEVLQAEDGRQGLEIFTIAPADLVVTDLIMPGQEGIETIMQLRRDHPGLPILAVSGSVAHAGVYLDLARKLGASRTLAKPFSVEELLLAVATLVPPPRAPGGPAR
ncbi:MAG: response regulator [Verrucomicrobia bacterium]|nr:response regulator [Verrucomicrobiota bacterium]